MIRFALSFNHGSQSHVWEYLYLGLIHMISCECVLDTYVSPQILLLDLQPVNASGRPACKVEASGTQLFFGSR